MSEMTFIKNTFQLEWQSICITIMVGKFWRQKPKDSLGIGKSRRKKTEKWKNQSQL